jgi:hypothetical protein
MSTEIFADYMLLEAAKKQRVADYIEEIDKAHAARREAEALVL